MNLAAADTVVLNLETEWAGSHAGQELEITGNGYKFSGDADYTSFSNLEITGTVTGETGIVITGIPDGAAVTLRDFNGTNTASPMISTNGVTDVINVGVEGNVVLKGNPAVASAINEIKFTGSGSLALEAAADRAVSGANYTGGLTVNISKDFRMNGYSEKSIDITAASVELKTVENSVNGVADGNVKIVSAGDVTIARSNSTTNTSYAIKGGVDIKAGGKVVIQSEAPYDCFIKDDLTIRNAAGVSFLVGDGLQNMQFVQGDITMQNISGLVDILVDDANVARGLTISDSTADIINIETTKSGSVIAAQFGININTTGAVVINAGGRITTAGVDITAKNVTISGKTADYNTTDVMLAAVTITATGDVEIKNNGTGQIFSGNLTVKSAENVSISGDYTGYLLIGTSDIKATGTVKIENTNGGIANGTLLNITAGDVVMNGKNRSDPILNIPTVISSEGDVTIKNHGNVTICSAPFTISKAGNVTISGTAGAARAMFLGNVVISASGDLKFDPADKAVIYTSGKLEINDAGNVEIIGDVGDVLLNANVSIRARGNIDIENKSLSVCSGNLDIFTEGNVRLENKTYLLLNGPLTISKANNVSIIGDGGGSTPMISGSLTISEANDVSIIGNSGSRNPAITGLVDVKAEGEVWIENTGFITAADVAIHDASKLTIVSGADAAPVFGSGMADISVAGDVDISNVAYFPADVYGYYGYDYAKNNITSENGSVSFTVGKGTANEIIVVTGSGEKPQGTWIGSAYTDGKSETPSYVKAESTLYSGNFDVLWNRGLYKYEEMEITLYGNVDLGAGTKTTIDANRNAVDNRITLSAGEHTISGTGDLFDISSGEFVIEDGIFEAPAGNAALLVSGGTVTLNGGTYSKILIDDAYDISLEDMLGTGKIYKYADGSVVSEADLSSRELLNVSVVECDHKNGLSNVEDSEDGETHKGDCDICGDRITENHIFDADDTCTVCGAKKLEEPTTEATTEEPTTEADSSEDATTETPTTEDITGTDEPPTEDITGTDEVSTGTTVTEKPAEVTPATEENQEKKDSAANTGDEHTVYLAIILFFASMLGMSFLTYKYLK